MSLVRKLGSFRVQEKGGFSPLFFRTQAGAEPIPFFSSPQRTGRPPAALARGLARPNTNNRLFSNTFNIYYYLRNI